MFSFPTKKEERISSTMLHLLTRKLGSSYRQLASFIHEENLKTEALFTLAVCIFVLIILYA